MGKRPRTCRRSRFVSSRRRINSIAAPVVPMAASIQGAGRDVAVAVIAVVVVPVAPWLSVTVRVAVTVPDVG